MWLYSSDLLIPPPYKMQSPHDDSSYFIDEGFRAKAFGADKIARNMFYKACVKGSDLGCVALNHQHINAESKNIKDKCDLGDKNACFSLYQYYSAESLFDSFKVKWYLGKSCKLGHKNACEIESNTLPSPQQKLNEECFYNNPISCYKLADMYIFGRGVAKNINVAKQLLRKSCQNGLQMACENYMKILSLR